MRWQWNSQLPARSGVHVIDIVAAGGSRCVTTGCRSAGAIGVSLDAVAEAVDLEVEAVQVHGMRLRAQVDHAPARRLADAIRQPLGRRP